MAKVSLVQRDLKRRKLWNNTMAKVTYRGVSYDTDTRKATNTVQVQETYRGIKFKKELASA